MLDFSKIEAGKLELHPAEFEPAALATTSIELLATAGRGQGTAVCELRLAPDLPTAVLRRPLCGCARC